MRSLNRRSGTLAAHQNAQALGAGDAYHPRVIFITAKFRVRPEHADDWAEHHSAVHRGHPRGAGEPVVRLVSQPRRPDRVRARRGVPRRRRRARPMSAPSTSGRRPPTLPRYLSRRRASSARPSTRTTGPSWARCRSADVRSRTVSRSRRSGAERDCRCRLRDVEGIARLPVLGAPEADRLMQHLGNGRPRPSNEPCAAHATNVNPARWLAPTMTSSVRSPMMSCSTDAA